jgi:prolyl-tRNA editing enzyme YbaK/EbsC (Cys-tRNA(Pro) deacylase)
VIDFTLTIKVNKQGFLNEHQQRNIGLEKAAAAATAAAHAEAGESTEAAAAAAAAAATATEQEKEHFVVVLEGSFRVDLKELALGVDGGDGTVPTVGY